MGFLEILEIIVKYECDLDSAQISINSIYFQIAFIKKYSIEKMA